MRFSDTTYAVTLSEEVINSIKTELEKAKKFETGGILIGKYSKDHSLAHISRATGPGSNFRLKRLTFKRGIKGLQTEIDKAQERGEYYLGEWHSHPKNAPTPSYQDIQQMITIAQSKGYNCPEPILLIAGEQRCKLKLAVYVVTQSCTAFLEEDANA